MHESDVHLKFITSIVNYIKSMLKSVYKCVQLIAINIFADNNVNGLQSNYTSINRTYKM